MHIRISGIPLVVPTEIVSLILHRYARTVLVNGVVINPFQLDDFALRAIHYDKLHVEVELKAPHSVRCIEGHYYMVGKGLALRLQTC